VKRELYPRRVPSPKERAEHLSVFRSFKMALDVHAFVRARADLFYRALADGLDDAIPGGDPIWICGDAHGENLGAVADVHGNASLDLNDLDETVQGWAAHDVLRLALDMVVAARSYEELRGVETVQIVAAALEGYCEALYRRSADRAAALQKTPPQLRKLLRRTTRETRASLLGRRVDAVRRRFVHGPRYFPLSKREHHAVAELIQAREIRTLAASLTDAAPDSEVQVIDAAFRVAGTGSLGCSRAAALVHIGKPKKRYSDEHLRLIDIKQALPGTAIRHPDGATPSDDAERVVCGARALVPAFGDRMVAAELLGVRVVVRELMPQDRKVSLNVLKKGEAAPIARTLGAVVGRAHGRQMSANAAAEWAETIKSDKRGRPPAWLWEALIELVAIHERAYLEHCAAFAEEHPDVR
jgi:uncharacterized protein (DUF2252 family)